MAQRPTVAVYASGPWLRKLRAALADNGYDVLDSPPAAMSEVTSGVVIAGAEALQSLASLANVKGVYPFCVGGDAQQAGAVPVLREGMDLGRACYVIDHEVFGELREHKRFFAIVPIVLKVSGQRFKGETRDLSGGGCLAIFGERGFPRQGDVDVELHDRTSGRSFQCKGVVRRVSKHNWFLRSRVRVGLQFLLADAAQKEALFVFLEDVRVSLESIAEMAWDSKGPMQGL